MIEFTSDTPAPDRPREELFSIDGKPATIPREFEPIEMARYAHMIEQFGGDQAAVWAMRYALGDEMYLAFINLPPHAVSKEQYAQVVGVITGRLVGLDVLVPGPKEPAGQASDGASSSPAAADPETTNVEPPDSEVWPDETPVYSQVTTQPEPQS